MNIATYRFLQSVASTLNGYIIAALATVMCFSLGQPVGTAMGFIGLICGWIYTGLESEDPYSRSNGGWAAVSLITTTGSILSVILGLLFA